MVTDLQVDELIQPIINIYQNIEYELLIEVAKRFANYDGITGALEWQLQKLQELGALNKEAVKIFAKYSKKSEQEIISMLQTAGLINLDTAAMQEAFEQGVLEIDPQHIMQSEAIKSTIEQSYKAMNTTLSLIKTKALESTTKLYINTLNQAYLESASGFYDINTAIKRGVQRMASQGIKGATYKRGDRYIKYSIEGTVRRDVITAVHQLSNRVTMQACEEMECEYVEVSQHLGARVHATNPIANHYGWQGKVYKIDGKEKGYPNLTEATGYPDDILGLGGVNCRHRMFPFWPEFSTPNPIKYNEEENKRIYEAQQQQRKLERDMRLLKKKKACADAVGDEETSEMLQAKINAKSIELDNWCSANNLKRDYSRELVQEQITKKGFTKQQEKATMFGASKNANGSNSIHKVLGNINEFKNDVEKNKYIDAFVKKYANSDIEHMILIDNSGNIHYITSNSPNSINLENIDVELKDSYSLHTHPINETQYTFSNEIDITTCFNENMNVIEACDSKYRYWFERPKNISLEQWQGAYYEAFQKKELLFVKKGIDISKYEENIYHIAIEETCNLLGIKNNYKRWRMS